MKLTIKTLQQMTFKIDIEPDKSVKELKEKIEKEQGKEFPVDAQKLIYSGRILADDVKLSEYDIEPKKFMVLMITRPPTVPKPTPAAIPEKPPASVTQAKEESVANDAKPKPPTTRSSSAAAAAIAATIPQQPTPATNTAAAPTTTAPSSVSSRTPTSSSTPATATATSISNATNPATSLNQRLVTLINQPHFRQIQDLIQQSPHLLSSTIEALAGTDPEMYNFISENPDIFVTALNHPPTLTRGGPTRQQSSAAVRPDRIDTNPLRQQPVVDQVLGSGVSEHDKEAIERLKELGFSEYLAIQAYMACDKDEQLAANLLFQMDQ